MSNSEINAITRESIYLALQQLLETKTLAEITITEITSKAGVSRMAYYRNYQNKEEILSLNMVKKILMFLNIKNSSFGEVFLFWSHILQFKWLSLLNLVGSVLMEFQKRPDTQPFYRISRCPCCLLIFTL